MLTLTECEEAFSWTETSAILCLTAFGYCKNNLPNYINVAL